LLLLAPCSLFLSLVQKMLRSTRAERCGTSQIAKDSDEMVQLEGRLCGYLVLSSSLILRPNTGSCLVDSVLTGQFSHWMRLVS
jgi:hypothetical protein